MHEYREPSIPLYIGKELNLIAGRAHHSHITRGQYLITLYAEPMEISALSFGEVALTLALHLSPNDILSSHPLLCMGFCPGREVEVAQSIKRGHVYRKCA